MNKKVKIRKTEKKTKKNIEENMKKKLNWAGPHPRGVLMCMVCADQVGV
jgi:hypothetical protein